MIAISVPIHEKMDCVVDFIENIRNYEPNSYIVFHVSKIFSSFDEEMIKPYENVFLNPKRNSTGMGLLIHHVCNFQFLKNVVDFDHFLMMSSNEMLIKHGLADHVKKHKNGFQSTFRHQRPSWHLFNKFQLTGHKWGDQSPNDFIWLENPEYITWESDCPKSCPDPRVSALLEECGWSEMIGGQSEGQFYEKDIFEQISDVYTRIWGLDQHIVGYETEEFIPMTVAKSILKKRKEKQTAPITFQNYTQEIAFDKEFVEKVMKENQDLDLWDNKLCGETQTRCDGTRPGCLCSPHIHPSLSCPNHENWSNSKYIYSLKRIPRVYNDPIRTLIRSYYK